jgi:diguanylate cyclase (GGDEF)-like protein
MASRDPTPAANRQVGPDSYSAAEAEALLAVHGPLAAAMERLVSLAAMALHVPFAVVVLTGDDRRCFGAGPALPPWATHDAGALWRSGLIELISAGPVEWRDTTRDLPAAQATAATALGIRSLLGVPIRSSSGKVLGVFCAADPQVVVWNADDLEMLQQFAAAAGGDWELRHNVAEKKATEQWREYSGSHDVLTGLANRAVLLERLRVAVARKGMRQTTGSASSISSAAPEDLVAVFFLDLNDFRLVNERFGHRIGDRLLASVGQRLRQIAGEGATVARLGGDEFAVLIERIAAPEIAVEMARRFRRILSEATVIDGVTITLTVSAGLALSTPADDLPEHLLRGADLAMLRAKHASDEDPTADPVVFDWKLATEGRAQVRLRDELRQALGGDEFVLHYMPIISLSTGRITGAEALLRWNHPRRGLLAPSDFLVVAEEFEIIVDVGRWVMSEASRRLSEWNAGAAPLDPRLTIAVNLSSRQFEADGFALDVERTMKSFGLPAASLVLEVTERVVSHDVDRAATILSGLRQRGAKIMLDDFGSGSSPLGYLQQLPLDGVKIDHQLVGRMDRDEQAFKLVRSIVTLARELRLDVVAEGISSQGHLKMLRTLGCTHGQGQLFSRAVPASAITTMLRERPW